MKTITLRYFDVNHTDSLTAPSTTLVNRIIGKLSSAASNRMMPINKKSSDKHDLISNYLNFDGGKAIAGTYLRITDSKDVPIIKKEILNQQSFSISSINENAADDEKTCLDYFYFCLNDKHLIITLDGRSSIARFETYINWLLSTAESGEDISFIPIVDESKLSIADIKQITVGSSYNVTVSNDKEDDNTNCRTKVLGVANDIIKEFFSDTPDFDDLMKSNICSADLVIKFSKPRIMSKEEYLKKTAGVILKPLEDPDGIKFASKGKKISGSQVLKSEDVEVDSDNGALSEQNVYLTMFRKIQALS